MADKVRIKIDIPFKDGITLPIYVWDYEYVPKMGRDMTFYEFALNPKTAKDAAHLISQEVKKQTKVSPGQVVEGFMDQVYQGATLGWSEEIGSYIFSVPAFIKGGMKSGSEDYERAVADYRKEQRNKNELFQFLRPKTSAVGQGTGMGVAMAASMLEPTPMGEAAVGAYGATRAGLRAFNPFAIAGTTRSATFMESILKGMVLSATHSAGAAEGYWKDRLSSVPAAMREGMEWGIIANTALFGSMAAFNGLARVPWVRSKLRDIDFHRLLGEDFEQNIREQMEGSAAYHDKFSRRTMELLSVKLGLDTGKLLSGKATHAEVVTQVDDALKDLRAKAAVESELTLGELGGPHWKAEQLQALVDDPVGAIAVREQLKLREAGDPARVSAALRENQPTPLLPSATDALNLRQSRLTGKETDPISGETYHVSDYREPVGLLGADPIPLTAAGKSQGVASLHYQKGYTANDVPLAGNFMETFSTWKGWPKIYEATQKLRNARIGSKESPRYAANGLSNELPAWKEFLDGVRYIPKSTAKEHGTTVKQQLNPKTGQWQPYVKKPHKGWQTRTRVAFEDFKVIIQKQNPKTLEWSDVSAGVKPTKGWKTRQKTVGGDWAVRLNDKNVSFESLHDMRQAMDQELGQLKSADKMSEHHAMAPYRVQLDDVIKGNPDMAKADNYLSALKSMEKAAASGEAGWNKSLADLKTHYEKLGPEEQRMFRTAMIQTVERKGFSSTQLAEPTGRVSSEISQVPGKMRMLYPEGEAGDAMYQQAMKEIRMSERMHETFVDVNKPSSQALTKREPQGTMKTLALLAKLPAYSFSMEFALGRDLIAKARAVDAAVSTGVARNLNRILSTKSGPEASAMIDELASASVRMRGNIPAADSLKAFADTLRSVGAYGGAGLEVDRMPPIQGTITGLPERDVAIPPGTFQSLLEGYEPITQNEESGEWEPSGEYPYDRTYPATEIGSSLLENLGVPAVDYIKEKVPYWWRGPQ
tara:strand:- start:78 stop:3044 length:2967 start_codon:yes stop_codon:yes gene_type:complete